MTSDRLNHQLTGPCASARAACQLSPLVASSKRCVDESTHALENEGVGIESSNRAFTPEQSTNKVDGSDSPRATQSPRLHGTFLPIDDVPAALAQLKELVRRANQARAAGSGQNP
jgi:hypothetical protein